ncbi:hypothetical protein [Streptomyces sp. NPDC101393]|uniref:hypothetical protein n=1 Tax=Streptomyces sp. NPDC101393 TaxID=3366141 RepID=UPI0038108C8B
MSDDASQCCTACDAGAPLRADNRPGLSAVAYRSGTFSTFRQEILDRLADVPALADLTSRAADDHTVTAVELWAAVADVLTFYQERLVNEAFLGTAVLRDSVARLVRLIGYELRPGTAATTRLAFTLEPGTTAVIPAGTRVQSVPAEGEKPQKFETLEEVTADARLNRLRLTGAPRPAHPTGDGSLGASAAPDAEGVRAVAALTPGDKVLVYAGKEVQVLTVTQVRAQQDQEDMVRVEWTPAIKGAHYLEAHHGRSAASRAYRLGRSFHLFGHDAPRAVVVPVGARRFVRLVEAVTDFTLHGDGTDGLHISLDGRYDGLGPGSLLLAVAGLTDPVVIPFRVKNVAERHVKRRATRGTRSVDAHHGTVMQLKLSPLIPGLGLDKLLPSGKGDIRDVVLHELLDPPLRFWPFGHAPVGTDEVYLPGVPAGPSAVEVGRTVVKGVARPGTVLSLDDVPPGRSVVLTDGKGRLPIGATVVTASIVGPEGQIIGPEGTAVAPQKVPPRVFLRIGLRPATTATLDPDTAVLLGNTAPASHGETIREEVLGDGDAAVPFQRFRLAKNPVTHLPAAVPGGVASSLRVFVAGVRWTERPTLYGATANDQVYTTRIAADGALTVQFGDGTTGARPPTGRANIVARYRQGLGEQGRVAAGRLATLLDRPTGVKGAVNPVAADGGVDPEPHGRARESAAATVRTFGRAVSLRDFEDGALTAGDVAKSTATWVWTSRRRAVHLTVAGPGGAWFSPEGLARIADTFAAERDPNHPLLLANHVAVDVRADATLAVDERYHADDVREAARAALLRHLSFEERSFAQPVYLSEVYRVLQEVPGVVSVDVHLLDLKSEDPGLRAAHGLGPGAPQPQPRLLMLPARPSGTPGIVLPAELAGVGTPEQDIVLRTTGGADR